jgi:hypothetical protein
MGSILRLKEKMQASRGQFKSAVESFRILLAIIQAKKEVWKLTPHDKVCPFLLFIETQMIMLCFFFLKYPPVRHRPSEVRDGSMVRFGINIHKA